MALARQAASISMGTGFPGDGLTCANEMGRAGLGVIGRMGRDEGMVGGGELQEAWKALSVAEFWSIWVATLLFGPHVAASPIDRRDGNLN